MARSPRSVFVNVPAGQTDYEIVAAIPGKAIRVHQSILVCGAEATDVTFNSGSSPRYLNVSGGGGATTPDQPGLAAGSTTVDLRVRLAADTWDMASTFQAIINQFSNNTGDRFWFGLHPNGLMEYDFHSNIDGTPAPSSSAPVPFAAGTIHWVRVFHDISAGTVNFYIADDEDGTNWTVLGDTRIIATNGMATTGSTPIVRVGTDVLNETFAGKIYRAMVIIDGETIIDEDWSMATLGTGPWTATTGEIWTALTTGSVINGPNAPISPLIANASNGGAVLPYTPIGWFETVNGESLTVTTSAGSTVGILLAVQEH